MVLISFLSPSPHPLSRRLLQIALLLVQLERGDIDIEAVILVNSVLRRRGTFL